MKLNKVSTYGVGTILATAAILSAGVASAQTTLPQGPGGGWGAHMGTHRAPGVLGTVSSVSGSTLTVTNKGFGQNPTPTTYTVDASNASVSKAGVKSSIFAIAVGDTVMVQGSVNGTSVVATEIHDGMPQGMQKGMRGQRGAQGPSIQGTGEPVVGGSVTAVNGSGLTVATKAGITYAVDASSAFVAKNNATSSISNVAVGDSVVVQGSVNGTSVSATSVVDQGVPRTPQSGTADVSGDHGFMGMFGSIGGMFHRLFGFF